MKTTQKWLLLVTLILAGTTMVSAQSKFDKWVELKNFHSVMSQTFHPSEEGNLNPIKQRITEMVEKAELLKKSTIPAEFNKPEVRAAVAKLATDSKKLQELITGKANDDVIKKALADLHDTFHLIVEKCSTKEHDHH